MGKGRSKMEKSLNRMKYGFWIFGLGIVGLFLITFSDSVTRHENCNRMNGILIKSESGSICVSKDIILK